MDQLPPGPRLPRLAQALRYTFDYRRFIASCHRRYGSTFTLRLPGLPPGVMTSDREAIRRLFTGDPLRLRHGNDLLVNLVGPRSLMLLEPAEHLQRRKLELPPFHGERVAVYERRIEELIAEEVSGWPAGGDVETHPRFQAVTLALILELVLGVRDREFASRLKRLFDSLVGPRTNLGLFLPALAEQRRWNWISRPVWRRLDRLDAMLREQIASTRTDPELASREDVLALLVRARDEHGQGLDDDALRDEMVTLVVAGHETTATAIAWGAELLAHHPQAAERLREEANSGDREYRAALAKEVLRLRTVVPMVAGRHSLEGFEIGGYEIGSEATLLVDADTIHHDPELYEAPERFRPERFLGRSPQSYAFLPFGGGAHRCLGASLATMELERALQAIAGCRPEPVGKPSRATRRGVSMAPVSRGRVRVAAAAA